MPDNIVGLTKKAAREAGVDPGLFTSLITKGERSWKDWQTSPAGAQGPSQLMPGTARGLANKYGINPNTRYGNLLGGAYYLKEQLAHFKDPRKAVAAYNAGPGNVEKYNGVPPFAETQRYVRNVMGGVSAVAPPSPSRKNPYAERDALDATMPDFGLKALMDIAKGGSAVSAFTSMVNAPIHWERMHPTSTSAVPSPTAGSQGGRLDVQGPRQGGTLGEVSIAAGADRKGAKTQRAALLFARRVAGVYGQALTVGTGTNHNQLTVNGRVSDHWSGHAVDIPSSGDALTRLGQAALIAAGADPVWARKQKGGLYNIGNHQVIFNTTEGGNHWNHLHISA